MCSGFRHGGDRCHHCNGRGREKWVSVSDNSTVTVSSWTIQSFNDKHMIVVIAAVTVTDRDPPSAACAMENSSFWSTSASMWNGNMTEMTKDMSGNFKSVDLGQKTLNRGFFPGPTTLRTMWWSSQAGCRWITSARCPARRFLETLTTW